MNEDDEQRIAAHLAKTIAMMCVRNTILEDIHAGLTPVTRTGDYSDVMVIDADGRNIPWPEVSQFDDDTMRDLMRQVVNRVYPGGKQLSSMRTGNFLVTAKHHGNTPIGVAASSGKSMTFGNCGRRTIAAMAITSSNLGSRH